LPPQGPQGELVSGARSALLDVLELANARTWEPRIIAELSVPHTTQCECEGDADDKTNRCNQFDRLTCASAADLPVIRPSRRSARI